VFESKLGQFLVGRESNGKRHRRRVKIKRWTGTRRRTRGARSCHRWDAAINRDVAALWRRHVTWDFSLSFSFFSLSFLFLFCLIYWWRRRRRRRWGGGVGRRPSNVSVHLRSRLHSSAFFRICLRIFSGSDSGSVSGSVSGSFQDFNGTSLTLYGEYVQNVYPDE